MGKTIKLLISHDEWAVLPIEQTWLQNKESSYFLYWGNLRKKHITITTAETYIEFLKLPQVAFEQSLTLNMGQILSIPFIITGIVLLCLHYKAKRT